MTRRKKMIYSALLLFAFVAVAWQYFSKNLAEFRNASQSTPGRSLITEMPGLNVLTESESFIETFNADSSKVRIVLLLSPSWLISQRTYHQVQNIFSETVDENLRLYNIWMPVQSDDTPAAAHEFAKKQADSRILHFWDEEKIFGERWQKTLLLDQLAWDVFFIYNKNQVWQGDEPPVPAYWMRQLKGVEAPLFDQSVFRQHIEAALADSLN